jgi:hypothetical protein
MKSIEADQVNEKNIEHTLKNIEQKTGKKEREKNGQKISQLFLLL